MPASGDLVVWRPDAWEHPDQKALIETFAVACSRLSWNFRPAHGMASTEVKLMRAVPNAIIWNGTFPSGRYLVNMRRRLGLPTLVVEQGWMTQSDHWHLDYNGLAGDSSLCDDPLDWVEGSHYDMLDSLRDKYWPDDWRPPRRGRAAGKTLVLGQLMRDTAVFGFCPYETVEDLIFDAEKHLTPGDMAFRPHPYDKSNEKYEKICRMRGIEYVSPDEGSLRVVVMRYRGAMAINSTGLYETAMMGLGAAALGECPLTSHSDSEDDVERLLAAMASRQFRKADDDVIPLLESMGEFDIRGGG